MLTERLIKVEAMASTHGIGWARMRIDRDSAGNFGASAIAFRGKKRRAVAGYGKSGLEAMEAMATASMIAYGMDDPPPEV